MKEFPVSPDGFINMVVALNKGTVVEELDRELMKGLQAIQDFGGSTDITLKVSIKRMSNMDTAVVIKHDVTAKHPKEDRKPMPMFIVGTTGIVADLQEQQSLELKGAVPRIGGLPQPVRPKENS